MAKNEAFALAFERLAKAVDGRSWERDPEDQSDPSTVQAMQIVLHLPKQDPPKRHAVLQAAARAAVAVCLDPRAGADFEDPEHGYFARALDTWYRHRIRKVTRRARNAAWRNVQDLAGVSVENTARAFIPSAVSEVPAPIAKLQIAGTDLPASQEPEPQPGVPVLYVDASLGMSAGKTAAQVGHASMLLAGHQSLAWAERWAAQDFALSLCEVGKEEFEARCANPGAVTVVDAGFTEIAPNTPTVCALPEPVLPEPALPEPGLAC
ncbi:aminoacyl-tRNA hydrolase [Corynebacterium pseudopelargi]|uniref:peptidyl-tRNA hydrolase n=1 Tax=Corynebacterium pseudopelargi TaxID=2080757 RepID=A0A3G6ISW5_9CORY|nr:peptidyl-tRNA hydrolase [Corynebacterium pseudopelargi]AZA08607.1 peptidyl-tRNA hydrolase [Corynebacterium pseudopelargi]